MTCQPRTTTGASPMDLMVSRPIYSPSYLWEHTCLSKSAGSLNTETRYSPTNQALQYIKHGKMALLIMSIFEAKSYFHVLG